MGSEDYVNKYVIPCIGEMATSSSDDVDWRSLNHLVLEKFRHDDEKLRCRAPSTVLHLVERLNDEYRISLTDLRPLLQELMEDDSQLVEKHCCEVIGKMKQVLGESFLDD